MLINSKGSERRKKNERKVSLCNTKRCPEHLEFLLSHTQMQKETSDCSVNVSVFAFVGAFLSKIRSLCQPFTLSTISQLVNHKLLSFNAFVVIFVDVASGIACQNCAPQTVYFFLWFLLMADIYNRFYFTNKKKTTALKDIDQCEVYVWLKKDIFLLCTGWFDVMFYAILFLFFIKRRKESRFISSLNLF